MMTILMMDGRYRWIDIAVSDTVCLQRHDVIARQWPALVLSPRTVPNSPRVFPRWMGSQHPSNPHASHILNMGIFGPKLEINMNMISTYMNMTMITKMKSWPHNLSGNIVFLVPPRNWVFVTHSMSFSQTLLPIHSGTSRHSHYFQPSNPEKRSIFRSTWFQKNHQLPNSKPKHSTFSTFWVSCHAAPTTESV